MRRPGAVEVVDVLGTCARRTVALDVHGDFAIAGTTLCTVDASGLRTHPLEGAAASSEPLDVPVAQVRVFRGRTAAAAVVGDTLVSLADPPQVIAALQGRARCMPLLGRAVLSVTGSRIALVTPSRTALDLVVPGGGNVLDAAPVFGGRLLALVMRDGDARDAVVVLTAAGQLAHRTELPAHRWHAFAIERGHLLVGTGDDQVVAVDLRYGRILGSGKAPHPIAELVVDDDGKSIVLASPTNGELPIVSLLRLDDILRATSPTQPDDTEPAPAIELAPPPPQLPDVVDEPVEAFREREAPFRERVAIDLPDLLPLALGRPVAAHGADNVDTRAHLTALLDLVAARAALAIAEGWHEGRISADVEGALPFEHEVLALAGVGGGFAPNQLADAHARLLERANTLTARVHAFLEAGNTLPFVELAREYALSPIATQVLLIVMAPRARGEIARLYRILANETGRPTCDDALVELLVGDRDGVACELTDDAPLVRSGLVVRDRRGLDVDSALLDRMRGLPLASIRVADRTVDELVVDRAALRTLVLELAEDRPALRIAIRGRRGAGRHTTIAALAARVGRSIACIDVTQLPRAAQAHAEALRRELARAMISRAIPVISGVEVREGGDADLAHHVRQVLRAHAGPLVVRTTPDANLPLDAGYVDVELPPLAEAARARAIANALGDLPADANAIARRYRIGPGTICRVVDEARKRIARSGGDPTTTIDAVARQHVAARIGNAAQRVTRLATWDQIALPEDMLDSLRELIGRARHGRTVFEDWGYDRRISTARGLTALFYGPPGTGKTMVAGLIANELGLELYRIDLAKVMSKWVGETEKNLGEVFDAAEDGRLMLLFDEADSLFAKRSEVKSSNDRYANLEVNYLLQRLDSFEGVAVLTTNLEGSIDPAFKRRLSMRLYFPFPDEDLRARLWAAHVTPQIPTAGALDFNALARRFPLSGGYIRNSALRAAFLAAQENTPLSQSHLERAVLLEYRELGKLSEDGRME